MAGVAILLVMRGSNVERAVAGIRPASLPVAAETRESGQVSRPPRTGPVVTPPSMPHDINPRVADPGESIATPQWKNWHDAPPIDRARALDLLADKVVREQDEKADAQSVLARPIDLQQTVDAMTGQSWWNQSGYAIGGFSAEFRDGYALYEINFTRPAK